MTARHYSISYGIVTEESSMEGDAAERGWILPGGYQYPDTGAPIGAGHAEWKEGIGANIRCDDGISEVARDAIHGGFRIERGTRWLVWEGDEWEAETDAGDSGTEYRNFHPGNDITPEEWETIRGWVKAGFVPDDDDDDDDDVDPGEWVPHDDDGVYPK